MATASIARDRAPKNIVFGAGEVHINPYDANGNLTGERYLGSTPGFSLGIQTERTQSFDDDGPAAVKIVDFVRQIDRSFSFQCKEISDENLALFIAGADPVEVAVAATQVTDEKVGGDGVSGTAGIGVRQGRSYPLGATPARPLGIMQRPAGAIVLTDDGAATTFEESAAGTNDKAFRIDDRGRLYVEVAKAGEDAGTKNTTNIPDGTKLLIDYLPTGAKGYTQVVSGDRQLRAAIHYVEYPAAGVRRDFYAVNCNIGASGEFAVKSRENPQTMSFEAAIQEPTEAGAASLVITTVPA